MFQQMGKEMHVIPDMACIFDEKLLLIQQMLKRE